MEPLLPLYRGGIEGGKEERLRGVGKVNKAREDGEKGRGGKFGGGKFGRKRASGQSESEMGGEEWRNESNESGRDKARGYLSWKGGKTAGSVLSASSASAGKQTDKRRAKVNRGGRGRGRRSKRERRAGGKGRKEGKAWSC